MSRIRITVGTEAERKLDASHEGAGRTAAAKQTEGGRPLRQKAGWKPAPRGDGYSPTR